MIINANNLTHKELNKKIRAAVENNTKKLTLKISMVRDISPRGLNRM